MSLNNLLFNFRVFAFIVLIGCANLSFAQTDESFDFRLGETPTNEIIASSEDYFATFVIIMAVLSLGFLVCCFISENLRRHWKVVILVLVILWLSFPAYSAYKDRAESFRSEIQG